MTSRFVRAENSEPANRRMAGASLLGLALGLCVLVAIGWAVGSDYYLVLGLALAVAVAALALWALFTAPATLVLGLLALRPFVDTTVYLQFGGLTLGQLWGICLLGSLGVYWLAEGYRKPLEGRSWLIPMALPVAYAATTMTLGRDDLSAALPWFAKFLLWVLVALACEQIASSAWGQRMITRAVLVIAMLTIVAIAIAIAQNQYGSSYYSSETVARAGQGPHGLAATAVLVSAVVWLNAMYGRARWRWALLAALLGVGVAMSFVRTTILAFALLGFWFLVWSLRSGQRGLTGAALAALAGIAGTIYAFRDAMAVRVSDLGLLSIGTRAEMGAGSGRVGIWSAVIHSATSSPEAFLVGQGPLAAWRAVSTAMGASVGAHNDFLDFLIAGGIGLMALYVAVVIWLFWSMTRLARDTRQSASVREAGRLFAVVVVAYVVMAFFTGMAFGEASLVMAMIVGLARGMHATPGHTFMDV